ncbi:MAG TPA: hypothetical protein VH593_29200 [Ktedonobacteraceae bacterium]
MPIQGLKFNILTGHEAHLSFQATGSFTAYNPNDGYALIALDRTCTLLDYDHKLPSQSGGHFPGPINSYLSIYFVDQSGAGLSGQIIVYASPDVLQIPQFWSIGRAIQSQVTSLDLIQGVQPPNPPANTTRLWSDASGHLHLAQSTGADYTVLDTNNYSSIITVGGDVRGPISNIVHSVRNANWIYSHDSGGTEQFWMTVWSDNNAYYQLPTTGGNFIFRRSDNANLATISAAGLLNAIQITANGAFVSQAGDIGAHRNDNTGVIYLGDSSHYLYWDGTWLTLSAQARAQGAFDISGGFSYQSHPIISFGGETLFWDAGNGGYRWVNQGNSVQWAALNSGGFTVNVGNTNLTGNLTTTGTYRPVSGSNANTTLSYDANTASGANINTGGLYSTTGITAAGRIMAMQGWVGSLTGNTNCFLGPNIGDYRGQALAQAWQTWASVDHAIQYNLPVQPVDSPITKVQSIEGVYYQHMSIVGDQPLLREDQSFETVPTYGFSAKDVYATLPELVGLDPTTNEPISIDLDRMMVVLWEAFKEYTQTTDARLTKLEQPV